MRVVILAGGLGTRLAEETEVKPKPMVEIGGRPVLWHIMKHYAHYGFNNFFVALGYRGDIVKRYFVDQCTFSSDMLINLRDGKVRAMGARSENWLVHLVDTGQETMTGGRIRRMEPYLKDETFMMTYGDGVSNVDLLALLQFHQSHGCLATVTAVRPPSRFGGIVLENGLVTKFTEKSQIGEGWINGGFLVLEPGIFDFLEGDASVLETDGLERLAANQQLAAYCHEDFWQCMDTLRDKRLLEQLWVEDRAPWKVWE